MEEGGESEAAGQAMERWGGGCGGGSEANTGTSFTFHLKNTKQVYTTNNVYQELLK